MLDEVSTCTRFRCNPHSLIDLIFTEDFISLVKGRFERSFLRSDKETHVKTLDWAELLRHHPIFSVLRDEEVRWLLQDDVGKHRDYPAATTIIHAGEVGDSIFLIGAGSVEAILPLDGDSQFSLSVMRKGEVFGEIGFFEEGPRSATAIAREACTLLEIDGRDFRKILENHPDIELKVLLKVSERLRNANEQILKVHLRGIDERLNLFNQKLDVEHRIFDTSLRAAQTVFDQTKQRADEVISSFERTRTLLQVTASIIGAIVTVMVTGLGYFGYNELKSVRDMGTEVRNNADSIKKELNTVKDATKDLENTRRQLDETRKVLTQLLDASFFDAIKKEDIAEAKEVYARYRGLLGPQVPMPENMFNYVELRMQRDSSGTPADWSDLLKLMAEDAQDAGADRQQAWAFYLLLANCVLTRPDDFEATFTSFQEVVAQQKRRGLRADRTDKLMLERFAEFFTKKTNQEKQRSFDKVVGVARSL